MNCCNLPIYKEHGMSCAELRLYIKDDSTAY